MIITTNYRRNLIEYWQQYFTNWEIPKGYHVHHIKPKCLFADKDDPVIHHPKNLIALHPDDHASIHRCRGDKLTVDAMLVVQGRIPRKESGLKQSKTKLSKEWKESTGIIVRKKQSKLYNSKKWKETIGKIKSEKVSNTVSDTEYKLTKGKIKAEKISKMRKSEVGINASKKASKTKQSTEWKSTTGKEAKEKELRTKSSVEYKTANIKICEYCYKELDRANYARWHGENCNHKGVQ